MRRLVIGVICTVFLGAIGTATSIIPPSFERLVAEADLVFEGEVVDVRSQLVTTPTGRAITTDVSFRVLNLLKGSSPAVTVLEFLGGTVGQMTMTVDAVPQFENGDHDILFVNAKEHLVSPVVGFHYGRFRVAADPSGISRVYGFNGAVPNTTNRGPLAAALPTPMSTDEFKGAITREVTRQKNSGVR